MSKSTLFGVPPQTTTFSVVRNGKHYNIRVTLDVDKMPTLINRAIDNVEGRASDAYGALVVVASETQPVAP